MARHVDELGRAGKGREGRALDRLGRAHEGHDRAVGVGAGIDVEQLIEAGRRFISPHLSCEAILTVGAALHEILNPSCGVISIGPFGCMPSRLAESILSEKFTSTEKKAALNGHGHSPCQLSLLDEERRFPFLAIETDGNIFPQIIEARLEAFCLQARRLNGAMQGGEGE